MKINILEVYIKFTTKHFIIAISKMLRIPETHENFSLSKKEQDDQTIGLVNPRHLVCPFCKIIILPKG